MDGLLSHGSSEHQVSLLDFNWEQPLGGTLSALWVIVDHVSQSEGNSCQTSLTLRHLHSVLSVIFSSNGEVSGSETLGKHPSTPTSK